MPALTPIQKRTICDLARSAYDAWDGREEYERTQDSGSVNPFTAWRHRQQRAAVGLASLTLCTAEHYRPLLAHFHRLRVAHLAAAGTAELFPA